METMHAAGRRTLPPVPRLSSEAAGTLLLRGRGIPSARAVARTADVATERFVLGPPTGEQRISRPERRRAVPPPADTSPPAGPAAQNEPAPQNPADEDFVREAERATGPEHDAAQRFVTRLRAAAGDFADAAGAVSAVVREAVPPARHRRARCRVVLRYADGTENDVTFLGPAGAPSGGPSRHGFDRQVRRWLGAGQQSGDACLVPDPDAPGGLAVDVTAWLAGG